MQDAKLVMPNRIDLVEAERVESEMQREFTEITALAIEARDLGRAAAELDIRVREQRVDPETALWMYVRLRTFLVALRDEAEAEAAMIVEVARRDAERIRRGGSPLRISFAGALGARPARPEPEPAIRWAPAPALAAAPVVTIDLVALEQSETPIPSAPAAATTVPGISLHDPLVGMPAPGSSDDLDALDDSRGDADREQSETDTEFWATVDAQPWWRRRKKIVSSAVVLQVAAGLTAAVAVAIHFA